MSVKSIPAGTDSSAEEDPYDASTEPAVQGDAGRKSRWPRLASLGAWALGSLALIDQVVVSATNFATTLLLSNLCSQTQMGLFGLCWTIFGFQRTAQERMLSAPYMVFAHRPDQDKPTWLGSSLIHQRMFGIVCTIVAWSMAAFFHFTGNSPGMAPVMLSFGAMSSFLLLRDHVRAICSTHFRYDVSLAVDCATSVLQIGGIAALYFLDILTIWSCILVIGLACLIPTMTWLWVAPQEYRLDSSRYSSDWKTSWGFSKWLFAARAIGISGLYLIPWIVAYLMDEVAVGIFTVCTTFAGFALMFVMGINNFFAPRTISAFHTGGKPALIRSLTETIAVFGAILGTVTVAMYFLGDWLLGYCGPGYTGNGSVVFYLCLSMLAVSISIAWGNGLAALGKPRGYFIGEVAYFVVAVSLAWILIPRMELNGAALALVGASLAVSSVTGIVLLRLILQLDTTDAVDSESTSGVNQ